jgi:chromatin-remodeling ATPase INO80
MTKMLNILEDLLKIKNYSYFRLDGSTDISDRNEMVKAFQERDDIFCFLLSTRAGGLGMKFINLGINLTAANIVIFYDNDWNVLLFLKIANK